MDKYKFSNLSDRQHRAILDAIKWAARNIEINLGTAKTDAEALAGYIRGLEALCFIPPWERDEYLAELKKLVEKAGAKHEPLHDDTSFGAILQTYGDGECTMHCAACPWAIWKIVKQSGKPIVSGCNHPSKRGKQNGA